MHAKGCPFVVLYVWSRFAFKIKIFRRWCFLLKNKTSLASNDLNLENYLLVQICKKMVQNPDTRGGGLWQTFNKPACPVHLDESVFHELKILWNCPHSAWAGGVLAEKFVWSIYLCKEREVGVVTTEYSSNLWEFLCYRRYILDRNPWYSTKNYLWPGLRFSPKHHLWTN